jgi:hypothetical protein
VTEPLSAAVRLARAGKQLPRAWHHWARQDGKGRTSNQIIETWDHDARTGKTSHAIARRHRKELIMFSSSAGGKKGPPQVRPPPAGFRAPDVGYTDGRCRESRRWCKSVGHVPSPAQSITTLTLASFESQTGPSMSCPLLSSVRVQWLTGILQRYLAVLEGPSSRHPAPEEDTRLEPRGWRLLFPRRHAQVGLPVWVTL